MNKLILFAFSILTITVFTSCSTFTIDKGHGFTPIEKIDDVEIYNFIGDYRNTCKCYLKKNEESTMLMCVSNIEFLKDFTPIKKRRIIESVQKDLQSFKYYIEEFENRIAFIELINKPIKKISKDYLIDHFKELGKFTTTYDVIFEEMIDRVLNLEDEE